MLDTLPIKKASNALGLLPGCLGLRLDEIFLPIFAVHDTVDQLDKLIPCGHVKSINDILYLRFWPDTLWVTAKPANITQPLLDISHGVTHFNLRGVEALHFIAYYTTADLLKTSIRKTQAIRTQINHYHCVIWWENTRHVHIVTDRSLAQSFADHLRALTIRHDPFDKSILPRPTSPDAPERRG